MATAELVNRPGRQPPRQITLHLQPPISASLSGQTTGVTWTSATISHHFLQPVTGDIGNTHSGSRRYSPGKYLSPPAFCHEAARLPLARIAGRAPESLILLCHGITAKFVNGKEAAKLPALLQKLTATPGIYCIYLSGIGAVTYSSRDSRTAITALITAMVGTGVGQRDAPGKTAPSVSVGTWTVQKRRSPRSVRCTARCAWRPTITSCSGSASLFPLTKFLRIQKTRA